jgi:hypothetical protein
MTAMKGRSGNPRGQPPGISKARASTTKCAKKAPQKASKLNERGDVLEFLADVFQDRLKGHSPGIPLETRIRAALAFAPYRFPKLQAVHVTKDDAGGQTHEEWVKLMHRALTSSTEPELKLIEGEAVELGGAPDAPSDDQRGNT